MHLPLEHTYLDTLGAERVGSDSDDTLGRTEDLTLLSLLKSGSLGFSSKLNGSFSLAPASLTKRCLTYFSAGSGKGDCRHPFKSSDGICVPGCIFLDSAHCFQQRLSTLS